jgi:hypothetical protein
VQSDAETHTVSRHQRLEMEFDLKLVTWMAGPDPQTTLLAQKQQQGIHQIRGLQTLGFALFLTLRVGVYPRGKGSTVMLRE